MRGEDRQQQGMFLYASHEEVVPADHPLRPIRAMVDAALRRLDGRFDEVCGEAGRPSIAPERLLRAQLAMLLYAIRSGRMLVEQLRYNLLFRWFVGLGMSEEVWHATVFTKNRDRLLEGDVARAVFSKIARQAKRWALMSSEHFSVDGTMVEAWASQKSFEPKQGPADGNGPGEGGRNREVDFRGQRRRNETHESKTDPEARLRRKSQTAEAKLSYLGHVLAENRPGLIVNVRLAQNANRRSSAVDGRTTRHKGYWMSRKRRKLVEEFFGWAKVVGGLRKVKLRGREKVGWLLTLAVAAYNLVRMRNLMVANTFERGGSSPRTRRKGAPEGGRAVRRGVIQGE